MGRPERGRPSPGGLRQVWRRLWRLEFGIEIFHEFFAYKCWRSELLQDDLSTGQSSRGISMGIVQNWSGAFYDGKMA